MNIITPIGKLRCGLGVALIALTKMEKFLSWYFESNACACCQRSNLKNYKFFKFDDKFFKECVDAWCDRAPL